MDHETPTAPGAPGMRVATIPYADPYVDAVLPRGAVRAGPAAVPSPWLDPAHVEAHAAEVDVLHLHVGLVPLWPVALIVLFLQSKRSKFLRFNVVQSLAVNALGVGLYMIYAAAQHFPVIGWQSALVLPFAMPIWFFVDLYLAVKAYGGESVQVPIAADVAAKYAA